MLKVTKKIKEILERKELSENKLAQLIDYHSGSLNKIINGKEAFPEHVIKKIAPILDISPEVIKGWILSDKYPHKILYKALETKMIMNSESRVIIIQGKADPILPIKIDEKLKEKGLSRTALSKIINYSQGKLNQMIKGDEPMSPLVISKIAPVLEVTENEIISWIIADKYSADALRVAVES